MSFGECAVDLLDRRLGREDARIEARVLANHPTLQRLSCANRRSADHVADRPALHRDDRLMTITPVRCCCEAGDVSRWNGREHAFDLNGRDVMAFVDHDVAVGADQIVEIIAARECLDHRDVDSPRQSASAGAESPDRLRCDVEELAEPFGPLFDEGFAVDEDKGGAPAGGDQVCREHGLAPARGCAQDADVMLEERAGGRVLRIVEFAAKFEFERLAIDAFVA